MPMRAVYVEEDVIADWENQDLEMMKPFKENLNAINATYLLSILISLILVRLHGTASPAQPRGPQTNGTGGARGEGVAPEELCDGG